MKHIRSDAPSITNPLFINTVLLGSTPEEFLPAAAAAGFDQVELWTTDVDAHHGRVHGVAETLRSHELGLTDYQVLRDFDGAPNDARSAKRAEAIDMLDTAVLLGAPMVMVAASTNGTTIESRITEDLRWLGAEAEKRNLRIGYESLAWSTATTTLAEAWLRVREVDRQNVGIIVDSFHVFIHGRNVSDLDGIEMDRIFAVQLSDLGHTETPERVIQTARHHRLLPGDGVFPIAAMLERLLGDGYSGPIGLEVFSDSMKSEKPAVIARRGMNALVRVIAEATAAGRTAGEAEDRSREQPATAA